MASATPLGGANQGKKGRQTHPREGVSDCQSARDIFPCHRQAVPNLEILISSLSPTRPRPASEDRGRCGACNTTHPAPSAVSRPRLINYCPGGSLAEEKYGPKKGVSEACSNFPLGTLWIMVISQFVPVGLSALASSGLPLRSGGKFSCGNGCMSVEWKRGNGQGTAFAFLDP